MPDSGAESSPTQRFTVISWVSGGTIQAFIPALGTALPGVPSVDECLAGARAFVELALADDLGDLSFPSEVDVQTHVVEVAHQQQLRVRPELLAAALVAAVGDVVPKISDNPELLAGLLSTLTSVTVRLHNDFSNPLADFDYYEPLPWSEERLQQAVREALNDRLRTTQTTTNERARVRRLLQQAIARQLALARELNLDPLYD